jgi:hypothetical protein
MNFRPKMILVAVFFVCFTLPARAQCTAEGPNIDATEKYIGHASSEIAEKPDGSEALAHSVDSGFFQYYSSKFDRVDIRFMNVDCSSIAAKKSNDGHLKAFCKNLLKCVYPSSYDPRSESWRDSDAQNYDRLSIQSEDEQQTENLARALQHYVFLLQAQYRQAHNSTNDPFGAPK